MIHAVLLSGGLDSTTLLTEIMRNKVTGIASGFVISVSLKYPSNHNKLERQAAHKVSEFYGVPNIIIDVSQIFEGCRSSLTGGEIPEGHYTDENMKSTVVPLRNIIFTSVVASKLMNEFPQRKIVLYLAVHAGDHPIYPDCRPDTMEALSATIAKGSDLVCSIGFPYVYLTKTEIVKTGLELGSPYHLTRTCYTSNEHACGRCGSCVERLEAFKLNNATDPITYE